MSHTSPPALSALQQTYDYIIVGGGTAGPAVARRLAEGDPNASVLLLEAGPTHEDLINSHMPLGKSLSGSVYDWGYDTVPQKNANDRVIHIPRAKFLGGCSGMNGTLMVRGPKADYDRWAEAGCKGWGWDDVLPYFKKSETFHPTPELPASEYHGSSGPLHTTVHPLAPISADLIESYRDKGFAYKPDMFVEGEGEGVGQAIRTVYNGKRVTGADFLSGQALPNLTVRTSTQVLRIVLSRSSPNERPRAVAVEVEDQSPDPTTETTGTTPPATGHVFRARREIIISAGSYNSPALLMHSGIGPRKHLEEVHVDCVVDLKGVGENLQDHPVVVTFYRLNNPHLTYDRLLYPPGTVDIAVKEWMESKTGVVSRFPFGPFAYKRMNKLMKDSPEWKDAQAATGLEDPTGQRPTQPHIEYFSTELYGAGPHDVDFPTLPEHSAFGMITMLCGPQGRGTVRLRAPTSSSAPDPHSHPVIDHAYLSSPLDLAILAEGCRLGHEVTLEGKGTKDHVVGAWPQTRVHPEGMDRWKAWVKSQVGTCYHPAGTCKMGPDGDEWAVVDDRLRVRGVLGLRVADCSIMPWLNNGHTQAPAYMIGEKCAAFILEDNDATQ